MTNKPTTIPCPLRPKGSRLDNATYQSAVPYDQLRAQVEPRNDLLRQSAFFTKAGWLAHPSLTEAEADALIQRVRALCGDGYLIRTRR